jgi:hypothetical protein
VSRWLPASVAVLAVLLVVQDAHGAGRHHGKCSARGSQTVFQDSRTRVFTRTSRDDADVQRTVACVLADGRRFKLAQDGVDLTHTERVSRLSTVGRWLGYAVTYGEHTGVDTGSACALNLRTGKRRCGDGPPVLGIGVSRAGSLAWLTYQRLDEGDFACCQVNKLDAGAQTAVSLDSGSDIDKDSFAVGGRHIYWTKAGSPQSATMP